MEEISDAEKLWKRPQPNSDILYQPSLFMYFFINNQPRQKYKTTLVLAQQRQT